MPCLDTTLSLLGDLIAFPSVSANSNLALIDYASACLETHGAQCIVQHNQNNTKANLFATIGPQCGGGLVLSGHSDVVPVDGQQWHNDPFTMHNKNGRSYGRGSCDMKGFLAVCLACAPEFARLHKRGKLQRPVHFAFTYDEEVGCLGGKALAGAMANWPWRPAMAIIGEPTSMQLVRTHKSHASYITRVIGQAGHASLPHLGVNAVAYAAQYITKLTELGRSLEKLAPHDSPFCPPYSTIQVGQIEGGVAHNVIPENCEIAWEMRSISKKDTAFVERELEAFANQHLLPAMHQQGCGEVHTSVVSQVAGLEAQQGNQAEQLVTPLCSGLGQGVSFATEAGLFQQLGLASIVCGPGSIEQAHKANEYIDHSQLEQAHRLVSGLVSGLA